MDTYMYVCRDYVIAHAHINIWVRLKLYIKVGDCSTGRPDGSLFNSYNTEVSWRALILSLDCSTYYRLVPYNAEY